MKTQCFLGIFCLCNIMEKEFCKHKKALPKKARLYIKTHKIIYNEVKALIVM